MSKKQDLNLTFLNSTFDASAMFTFSHSKAVSSINSLVRCASAIIFSKFITEVSAEKILFPVTSPIPVRKIRVKMTDFVVISVASFRLFERPINLFFVRDTDFLSDRVLCEVFLKLCGEVYAVSRFHDGYKIKGFSPDGDFSLPLD